MPYRFVVAALLGFVSVCVHAEVLRCVDATGNVSYTDQGCPAGARQAGQVQVPDPLPPSTRPSGPAPQTEAVAPPAPAPAGPAVFDQRSNERAEAQQREIDRLRELERLRREAEYAQDSAGYPYPGYSGSRPARPQDMRPRLRSCDAGGCNDTQGNTYNRSTGKLERYQSIDGKTCRPVGTTVVCQ